MIVAIVQTRMCSTRLPGKVAADLCGRPLLWHVLERVKRASTLQKVILATTLQPEDDALSDIARRCQVSTYRGSEDDVLDRIYQAAKQAQAAIVVCITADCPLLDPAVIDRAVHTLLANHELDYVGTGSRFPEGLDVEACTFGALERAWREATRASEREHPTSYIALSGKFRTQRLGLEQDLSGLRWVVDEERDLNVMREIYEALFPTLLAATNSASRKSSPWRRVAQTYPMPTAASSATRDSCEHCSVRGVTRR